MIITILQSSTQKHMARRKQKDSAVRISLKRVKKINPCHIINGH